MIADLWDIVRDGFSIDEPWGNPFKLNGFLVLTLWGLRQLVREVSPNAKFIVHNAYEKGGHADKSQHPHGNAVDFHIESSLAFTELVNIVRVALGKLQVSDRVGFGIYPDWNNPGFHLDARGMQARWGRIGDEYVALEIALEYAREKGDG